MFARGYAPELHCADELDRLPALLARDGGAGRRELTKFTGAGTATPAMR